MPNLFALCLIFTSLTAAGLWSHESHEQQQEDVIVVKEGHRVVVVEYGDQGSHNTKVSISSGGQDAASHGETRHPTSTRDVICDAFGKCKHKIASVVEKAKETSDHISDRVSESAVVETSLLYKEKLERGVKVVKGWFKYWCGGWAESLPSLLKVLSLLGFGMALGMGVWTTFISSYVLAITLPRQQLAMVQSKIYPVYFKAMASSIGMALFGHVFSHSHSHSHSHNHSQVYVLVAALFMTLANSLYMEPRATKVMFEKLKLEKEEGRGIEDTAAYGELVKSRIVGLNKRLKNLNSYSSLLNLLTLMALTCHLLYLSHRLDR